MEIARRAVPGSEVHGFDISPALIDLARARSEPKGSPVTFEIADMATTAPKQIYDRLASRFGIMFFDDPGSAFGNLFRWLTPGGRFAFAVWGPQAQNPWMTTVRDAAAEIIDLASPDPAAPGPFRYAEVDPLRGLLDHAGFGELEVIDWNGELRIGGGLPAAEAAEFALASFASFGELLADAGGEALNDARRSLTARFSPHQRDGVVTMDACVYIVTGMRGMAR